MMATSSTPSLAMLRAEFDRLEAVRGHAAHAAAASPNDDALYAELDKASAACLSTLDQVAACPVSSLSDLLIKAYVFNWSANLVDGESYTSPTEGEQQIMRQLVAGLLDEALYHDGPGSHALSVDADIFGDARRGFTSDKRP